MRLSVGIHRPPTGCLGGFIPINHGATRKDGEALNVIPNSVNLISEMCCLYQSQSFCLAPYDESWKNLSAAIDPAAQFLPSNGPIQLIDSSS